ncbi:MAG: hypothetical protein AAF850_09170 [Pseudomonadota bacterium]
MSTLPTLSKLLLTSVAVVALAACTQGEDIESPGATSPGTSPGGGGGGGGGGGVIAGTCPAGFTTLGLVGGLTSCEITGVILSDLTVPNVSGVVYRLNGRIDIGVDVGADGSAAGGQSAVLTIEPGVTLFGASGDDFLVVNRGSRIEAVGSPSQPIVFTSAGDLERQAVAAPNVDDGGDTIGEWGGLVLLGQAPINRCAGGGTPGTVSCTNAIEGVTAPTANYGGGDAGDDSGALSYVQVRFAGNEISLGNELNGITLGGVGTGTQLDHIQVHNNSDDGIEFFGGTANARFIVLTGNDDESLDTDNGYTGNIQFLLAVQRDRGGDNVVEASSVDSMTAPQTNPTVANFTFIGASSRPETAGFRLNSGHIGQFYNGVVVEEQQCFRFQESAGNGNTTYEAADDPFFQSVLFDCAVLDDPASDGVAALANGAVNRTESNNSFATGSSSLSNVFFPGPAEIGATAFNTSTLDPFFQTANYIGAFSAAETLTSNWATGWTFALFPEPTCPVGTTDTGTEINGQTVCSVSGVVTDDLRLTAGNIYRLDGRVSVGVDVGPTGTAAGGDEASLTIEAGVTIFGRSGDDFLIVNRGSQIFSNGTRTAPVVFTSDEDLLNTRSDIDAISEWGGVVLLGQAPINRCAGGGTPGTATCTNAIEGVTAPTANYGGGDASDSSGALRFTQVRYAGNEISLGNELNGITFGGVGTGTIVEFVQVHNNSDDGVEFFGGTVNGRYIVLTGNDDESLDTDNGYVGALQYVLAVQRTGGGDNIVEASSVDASTSPQTNPKVANFTFIGASSRPDTAAFRLNSGHVGQFYNGVVVENQQCFRFQSSAGNGNATYEPAFDPFFESVRFQCAQRDDPGSDGVAALADGAIDRAGSNNVFGTSISSLMMTFVNGPNETSATAFTNLSSIDPFFDDTTYVGAVRDASDTWWQGWTCGLEPGSDC